MKHDLSGSGVHRLKPNKLLSMLSIGVLSVSCSTVPQSVEDSYFYRPPSGTVIQLARDITVPAGKSQGVVQFGRVREEGQRTDIYSPWCEFRLRRSSDAMKDPYTIKRGGFSVQTAYRGIDYSAIDRGKSTGELSGVFVASSDRLHWPAHAETSMENLALVFRLYSETQPEVASLACMIFVDAVAANHLTLSEIRRTLGNVAEIRLP